MESPYLKDELHKVLPVVNRNGSDSAMLDNTLEFLVMSGMDLPLAVMITIPEPWANNDTISQEKRDFYQYYATMMEPWDGPASILFSDGDVMGAVLDRNGLRPSRYYITSDGYMILSSEVGVLPVDEEKIVLKERLHPGKMLLVVGIMISYICSAITDLCITFANDSDIANLTHWAMGSFSGSSWSTVKLAAAVVFPTAVVTFLFSKPISAYLLGEGYAQSMGIHIRFFRVCIILLSSLLSACVTALAGPISFVGIAVPHITRLSLKTTKPVVTIPAIFLCGAVFCMFCDLIARTIFSPSELAIGTVTAVFGAPVVIWLMVKRQK